MEEMEGMEGQTASRPRGQEPPPGAAEAPVKTQNSFQPSNICKNTKSEILENLCGRGPAFLWAEPAPACR